MPLLMVRGNRLLTQPNSFFTAGAYTYQIPPWANFIDVILLGAGGGGQGMGSLSTWGKGGAAGSWVVVTLRRGVHIPLTTTTITGSIGAGGARGAGTFLPVVGGNGSAGGNTTATATGMTALTALGGAGGSGGAIDPFTAAGKSPGDQTLNGRLYQGGAGSSGAANPPGAGGGGALISLQNGNAGAPGAAWFFAYQSPPVI
ncbi:hypothetical protein SEA_XIANYUE_32 [Mycobacterium phage XianYue]|nr:hypothetical protein SEA_XIANYUE_32 [Mycobacterium phage XianYue]